MRHTARSTRTRGHDAFLVEWDQVTAFPREALSQDETPVAASA
jgi:hypothetical protein